MSVEQFRERMIVANAAGPVEAADDLLHTRCDWLACPTCEGGAQVASEGGEGTWCYIPCPDCAGTGHPDVRQVLAWGEAVATAGRFIVELGGTYEAGWNDARDLLRAVRP